MKHTLFLLACAAVLFAGCGKKTDDTKPADGTPSKQTAAGGGEFAKVQEILNANCTGCHGDKNPKGEINLTTHEGILKGGEDGAVVVAGDTDKSVLLKAIKQQGGAKKMPPQGKLSDADIQAIEAWVKAGAKS